MRIQHHLLRLGTMLAVLCAVAGCGQDEHWCYYSVYASELRDLHRVNALLDRAKRCDERGDETCKEQCFDTALSMLWQPERHKARMAVFNYFFTLRQLEDRASFQAVAQRMMQEAARCQEDACLSQAHVQVARSQLKDGKVEAAMRESSLGVIHAEQSGQEDLIISSQLMLAQTLARSSDKNARIDALNILLRARLMAQKDEDDEALKHCYAALARFYSGIGGFDSAAAYKDRELLLCLNDERTDSDAIQALRTELAEPLLKGVNATAGHHTLNDVIMYALRCDNADMLNEALLYYRNYFLEHNDLRGVAHLYQSLYPSALRHLRDEGTRLRIKAYIMDAGDQQDSAAYYYDRALASLKASGASYQYTYLQLFHGRALRRWGKPRKAITALQQGYEAVPSHLPFTIRLMAELDSSFVALGQYDSAYYYHNRYEQARMVWDSSVNGEALLRQQISAQLRERALAEERERHLREQRHFTQYLAIILGILLLFLALSLISSFRVPKWVITATGFFAFVVLFEFIIMLADEAAADKVHGEPVYLLLCKIGIILLLSPLHHKLEEKLLHYFYKHRLIQSAGIRAFARAIKQRIREKMSGKREA